MACHLLHPCVVSLFIFRRSDTKIKTIFNREALSTAKTPRIMRLKKLLGKPQEVSIEHKQISTTYYSRQKPVHSVYSSNLQDPALMMEKKLLQKLIHIIILLFPSFLLLAPHGGSSLYFLIILISIISIFKNKTLRELESIEKGYMTLLTFFLILTLFTYLKNNPSVGGLSSFEDTAKFFLSVFIFFLFSRVDIKSEYLLFSFILNAIIIGLYAQIAASGPWALERVTGVKGPMSFGYISLTLGFLSLAGSTYWAKKHNFILILGITGFILSVNASFLSQTRGAWIAIPALLILYFLYLMINNIINFKILFITILILTTSIFFTNYNTIKERTFTGYEEAVWFFENKTDKRGSVHDRLSMWLASWHIFKKNPIIGSGLNTFSEHIEQVCVEKNINDYITKYDNPHSTYFNLAITRGIIGLSVYIFIIISIFIYAIRLIHSDDIRIQITALLITIITSGYMHFSLTYSILEKSTTILFFGFYIPILLSHIISLQEKNTTSKRPLTNLVG